MIKILIVDDSRAVHAFLKMNLTPDLAVTTSVMNGQEGLDALRAPGADYDLILLDWEMPVLDGPSTVAALRADGVTTPVLVMTTRSAVEDITRMFENGATEYMFKPFTKDILFEKMEIALGRPVSHVA
jgi:two-component system chemotaxis response regulator CheY